MALTDTTVAVTLGFLPASLAVPDTDHPGLLRAGPRAAAPYGRGSIERHVCRATDSCRDDAVQPDLLDFGFDRVDLSGIDTLQSAFARVAAAGHISDDEGALIRSALEGTVLRTFSGHTLTVRHVASEGFIMRKSGPNGMPVVGTRSTGMNDHGSATSVHIDQDVYGTPLTQVMDGRAPQLFRHDSPDGKNHDVALMLVNLWIPLQQITQPLALADGRSVDRRRHQLRFGLGTQSFLERDGDMVINDIWTLLHDPDQRWYLRSAMDHQSAYVFNTLSTPHGACILPGEDVAEQWYHWLEDAEAAVTAGDLAALDEAVSLVTPALPTEVPAALRDAIAVMAAVVDEARRDPAAVCGPRAAEWLTRSRAARNRVIRMSLELRIVISVDT